MQVCSLVAKFQGRIWPFSAHSKKKIAKPSLAA
jgi:hypothetical protein